MARVRALSQRNTAYEIWARSARRHSSSLRLLGLQAQTSLLPFRARSLHVASLR